LINRSQSRNGWDDVGHGNAGIDQQVKATNWT
jgi:hypothetical protein